MAFRSIPAERWLADDSYINARQARVVIIFTTIQSLNRNLEQHPLLRVDGLGFFCRNGEELMMRLVSVPCFILFFWGPAYSSYRHIKGFDILFEKVRASKADLDDSISTTLASRIK
jgi:hypothetical protein